MITTPGDVPVGWITDSVSWVDPVKGTKLAKNVADGLPMITVPSREPLGGAIEIVVGAVRTSLPVNGTVCVMKDDGGSPTTTVPGTVPSKGLLRIVVGAVIELVPSYGTIDVT